MKKIDEDEELYIQRKDISDEELMIENNSEDEELYMSDVGTPGEEIYEPEEVEDDELYTSTSDEGEELLDGGIGSVYSEESLNSGDSMETYKHSSGRKF